jgi:hypothetical protein
MTCSGLAHYGSYPSEHAALTRGASNHDGEGGCRGEKKLIFSKSVEPISYYEMGSSREWTHEYKQTTRGIPWE